MNCKHEDRWEDGTTQYCSDCGDRVAYFSVAEDDWVSGEPGELTWTEDGWA